MSSKQTILGSNGVIGTGIARLLPSYTDHIRLVSRNPRKVNPGDECVSADLLDRDAVFSAVDGSSIVYLTAGLEYKLSVWKEQWPKIMENVVNACAEHGAKLVFFDNVYSYGRVPGAMTESTPMKPCSEKGKVRAKIADFLMNETSKGHVTALIARSADFYGKSSLSVVSVMVLDKLAAGKSAQWLIDDAFVHSYTLISDAARGTAILGNSDDAYNQIWHLPTDPEKITGKQFIERASSAFGVAPKYSILKPWMLKMVGWFNPIVNESIEMLYQNDQDYYFDSSKFEKAYPGNTTSYDDGLTQTVRDYRES